MLHNNERIVKNKIGLLNLAEELNNVSKVCKNRTISRFLKPNNSSGKNMLWQNTI